MHHGPGRKLQWRQTVCMAHAGRNQRILYAWRAEIPENLQFFRENFARISRDLDAGRAFFSDLHNPPTSVRAAVTLRDLRGAYWPNAREVSASGMPKSKNFAIISRNFYANFA